MRLVLALTAALGVAACSSPDDASGDFHLELVQAPTTATPGSVAPQSVLVRVANAEGTSIPGVPVTWSIRSGGGHLTPSADTSGVDGLAAAQWTPGLLAGSQAIGASVYDQPALTITVSAEALHADKLSTTFERGCGLRGTEVWCWREGYAAQSIRRILPQFEAHDVAATYSVACILDAPGTTYCNRTFENEDPQDYSLVSGLPPLKSIVGGGRTLCGVAAADGTPWCWQDFAMVATQVSPSLGLSHMSVGLWYACGLDGAGSAWCWDVRSGPPALVPGGHVFRSVSAHDENYFACGIEGSEVWCWASDATPQRVAGVNAGQVALGWPFALLNTGPVTAVADVRTEFGPTATMGIDVYEERAFPYPVREVYPTCVLTYDSAAYCLAVKDVNAAVFPVESYWRAVPAPQP